MAAAAASSGSSPPPMHGASLATSRALRMGRSTRVTRVEPVVTLRGVTKRFGALEALAGIDLDIFRGEIFALLGANGAGKTTLIATVAGLLRATAGEVRVLGHDVVR